MSDCRLLGSLLAVSILVPSLAAQELISNSPYFPLAVGNQWTYRMGEQKVVVRVVKHEVIETKNDKGEKVKTACALLQAGSGERQLSEHVAVKPDGIYRYTSAGKDVTPPLCFFKLPPRKGESWPCEVSLEGIILKGTFVADEVEVTVPAGKFKCHTSGSAEFLLGGSQKMEIIYWFAPNIGVVKQLVRVGNFDLLLELEKFEKR